MNDQLTPVATDQQFFAALIGANVAALNTILTNDFILVDVMKGSMIDKASLLHVLGSGQLKFESIEPAEVAVRMYGSAAVVTGRTQMQCRFQDQPFAVSSRYTHVYVLAENQWRLASAQGTQIVA